MCFGLLPLFQHAWNLGVKELLPLADTLGLACLQPLPIVGVAQLENKFLLGQPCVKCGKPTPRVSLLYGRMLHSAVTNHLSW